MKYAPNSAGWQLYPAGSRETKPNMPVKMLDVANVRSQRASQNLAKTNSQVLPRNLRPTNPVRLNKKGKKKRVKKTGKELLKRAMKRL